MKTTARTMEYLTKQGIDSDIVERYNQFTKQRKDLFHIIDIIALYHHEAHSPIKGYGICGIQACGTDFSSHDRKVKTSLEARKWIECGGILELWGWRKLKVKRGGKAYRWTPRIKRYKLKDLRR